MMNRQELLDQLARRMNLDKVPEPVVEEADADGFIEDVLASERDESFDDLLHFARTRMRFHRRMQDYEQRQAISRGESQNTESFEGTESTSLTRTLAPKHGEEERRHVLRASAFEEYLAKTAASERDVHRFRRRFLPDGETISLEEASALIASPVAACVPASRVRPSVRSLISPLDHTATSDEKQGEDEGSPIAPVGLSADPLNERSSGEVAKQEQLLFADTDDHVLEVWVGRLSVLDELRRISVRLARVYPWEEAEASRYILTARPPRVPALVGRLQVHRDRATTYGTITLTVQPWVPADVVYGFYRDMRQEAFAGDHQTISERKIAVFRFVMSQHYVHPPEDGEPKYTIVDSRVGPRLHLSRQTKEKLLKKPKLVKPPWKVMLDRWNEQYSGEPYKWSYKDEANFKRDFHEARKTIVHPQYDFQVGA
jgi:hypothetical protein